MRVELLNRRVFLKAGGLMVLGLVGCASNDEDEAAVEGTVAGESGAAGQDSGRRRRVARSSSVLILSFSCCVSLCVCAWMFRETCFQATCPLGFSTLYENRACQRSPWMLLSDPSVYFISHALLTVDG